MCATGTYGVAMTPDEPEGQGGNAGDPTADWNWGLGIALGTGAGIVLGTVLDNMAFMAIGIAFFPVIAMIFRSRPKDKDGS